MTFITYFCFMLYFVKLFGILKLTSKASVSMFLLPVSHVTFVFSSCNHGLCNLMPFPFLIIHFVVSP